VSDLRIIIVTPSGRDGPLIVRLLARVGLDAVEQPDCESACREAASGVGAFVIADEALTPASTATMAAFISAQPSWSDVPVIILTTAGEVSAYSEARRKLREPLGNLVLIERPVRPETFISTVNTAVRARKRQYDVRDHIRQEKLASDALRKSEKLAIAGRLAASIAHEINNPLEAVTNLHYLMASATSLEQIKTYLASADQELARVVEITTQTLRFHRESSTPTQTDIAALLNSVLKLYQRRITSSKTTLRCDFDDSVPIVGFPGELRQLFANLISNALDAMPNGGCLSVRVQRTSELRNGFRPGVRIIVADTGGGIPLHVRSKILEPFISTKAETGTGLGLWVSSEIVTKHGGRMRFRSRVGSGTVFRIFLPATPPAR
jgi:signal transduction histidine kinase